MTIVAHKDADNYLAKPDPAHFLFLVFGADQGLVAERSQKLIARSSGKDRDSPNVVDFSGDSIASDPLALIDELHSIGLFDLRPNAIRIVLGSKTIIPALELVLRAPPSNRIIVVQGGELKRDAPLRKWFEKQDSAVSIECYFDQARDIRRLLDAEVSAADMSIEPDARDLLIARLGEDRLLTRSEIEKLLLYVKGRKTISVEDVNEILIEASAISIETLIAEAFSSNLAPTVELSNKSSVRSTDHGRLIAATLRYALSVHRVRADLDAGAAFDGALQTLVRLVNGHSRKRETAAQLQQISTDKAASFVIAIYRTIKKTRQNGSLSDDQLSRLLISLARSLQKTANRTV